MKQVMSVIKINADYYGSHRKRKKTRPFYRIMSMYLYPIYKSIGDTDLASIVISLTKTAQQQSYYHWSIKTIT
ncbi:Uncharacterised protein [Legionella sainthelensi]|nr:Uncharacterised protein [Legionella sainthelensi]